MSAIRVAIVARAVYPFHGVGGLERSVYDLARHLAREGMSVTVITRDPSCEPADGVFPRNVRTIFVPYRTFPFANRRGTTVLDRSTAYPLFGLRAGRGPGRTQSTSFTDSAQAFSGTRGTDGRFALHSF